MQPTFSVSFTVSETEKGRERETDRDTQIDIDGDREREFLIQFGRMRPTKVDGAHLLPHLRPSLIIDVQTDGRAEVGSLGNMS
jgi:hypothetical protein